MSTQPQEPSTKDPAYQAALRRAETLRAYYAHLLLYLLVITVAFFINVLTRGDDGRWWFYWPLAAWGIAIAIHTAVVFGGAFSPDWRLRKADEIYRRSRDTSSQT